MKYRIVVTNRFKKKLDFLCLKRKYDRKLIEKAIHILANTGTLPKEYRPHILHGDYEGIWECHIESDWVMLWIQDNQDLILVFTDTGTHSDIFKR